MDLHAKLTVNGFGCEIDRNQLHWQQRANVLCCGDHAAQVHIHLNERGNNEDLHCIAAIGKSKLAHGHILSFSIN